MTDDDYDEVFRIKEELWDEVHDLVDQKLVDVPSEIAEEVRSEMTEGFRFWKR